MTESEIMKAWECCSKHEINGLNIFTYGDVPMRSLLKYALDLINRKNAEIEEKTKRLREVLPIVQEIRTEARTEARDEAIKEFAEKVAAEFEVECVRKQIYQIAKEMGVEL